MLAHPVAATQSTAPSAPAGCRAQWLPKKALQRDTTIHIGLQKHAD
jgi:hypothetical protein